MFGRAASSQPILPELPCEGHCHASHKADARRAAEIAEPGGQEGKPTKRLQAIVDKLVELAMKGDFYAIQEIFDRVDGRVPQPVTDEKGKGSAALPIPRRTHARRTKTG